MTNNPKGKIMKRFTILVAVVLFVMASALSAVAQTGAKAPEATDSATMQMYHLVIMKKGPNWISQNTDEGADLRMEIIKNLKKAARKGIVITAGLVNDETDAEFVVILNVKTKYEALEVLDASPNIKNGKYRGEVYSMFAPKGLVVAPK